MNRASNYELDKVLVQEYQRELRRSGRAAAGPLRRFAGALLIHIGEWMRGKAEAATEVGTDTPRTSLKAA